VYIYVFYKCNYICNFSNLWVKKAALFDGVCVSGVKIEKERRERERERERQRERERDNDCDQHADLHKIR